MTRVEDAGKVNHIEEEKHRRLGQANAALKAKLEFIQVKYDFTTNVNLLHTEDFKSLVTSNDMVNVTVKDFVNRLDVVKEDIQKYEAMKYEF